MAIIGSSERRRPTIERQDRDPPSPHRRPRRSLISRYPSQNEVSQISVHLEPTDLLRPNRRRHTRDSVNSNDSGYASGSSSRRTSNNDSMVLPVQAPPPYSLMPTLHPLPHDNYPYPAHTPPSSTYYLPPTSSRRTAMYSPHAIHDIRNQPLPPLPNVIDITNQPQPPPRVRKSSSFEKLRNSTSIERLRKSTSIEGLRKIASLEGLRKKSSSERFHPKKIFSSPSPEREPALDPKTKSSKAKKRTSLQGLNSTIDDCKSPHNELTSPSGFRAKEKTTIRRFLRHASDCTTCRASLGKRSIYFAPSHEKLCPQGHSLIGVLAVGISVVDGTIWREDNNVVVNLDFESEPLRKLLGYVEECQVCRLANATGLIGKAILAEEKSRHPAQKEHSEPRSHLLSGLPEPYYRIKGEGVTRDLPDLRSNQTKDSNNFIITTSHFLDNSLEKEFLKEFPQAIKDTEDSNEDTHVSPSQHNDLASEKSEKSQPMHEESREYPMNGEEGDRPREKKENDITNNASQILSSGDEENDKIDPSAGSAKTMLANIVSDYMKNALQELLCDATSEAMDGLEGNTSQKRQRHTSTSSSSQESEHRPRKKRASGGGSDPGDNGDDSDTENDDDNRPPKKGLKLPVDGSPSRRLKCPFYQRQPEKYGRHACRGEGFTDMAKLKDHIKRVHTQPLRCSRCWRQMKSQDSYVAHLQEDDICEKRPEPPDDRISMQMLARLDFKKAPYSNARNTEQKWRMLYSVLFPNDKDIPSPYDQHGLTPRLERVLYEALEEELSKELGPVLEPILCRIKERIPSIVMNCKMKLLQMSPESDSTSLKSSALSTPADPDSGPSRRSSQAESPSKTKKRHSKTASQEYEEALHRSENTETKRDRSISCGSITDGFTHSFHGSSPGSIFDANTLNDETPSTKNRPSRLANIGMNLQAFSPSLSLPDSGSSRQETVDERCDLLDKGKDPVRGSMHIERYASPVFDLHPGFGQSSTLGEGLQRPNHVPLFNGDQYGHSGAWMDSEALPHQGDSTLPTFDPNLLPENFDFDTWLDST